VKLSKISTPLALVLAAVVILPSSISPAAASTEVTGQAQGIEVSVAAESPTEGVVSAEVTEVSGITGTADIEVTGGLPESIDVVAEESDGSEVSDSFLVEEFTTIDKTNFSATLRSVETGESFEINTTLAQQQALPIILVILARIGLQAAMKQFSKIAIQTAAKKYALSLNAAKWGHIIKPSHKWTSVGATNKTKVADLMGKAIANGKATKARDHIEYVWKYQGKTIVVRTSKAGHVSNGWVK
jgi:hypothetical protein